MTGFFDKAKSFISERLNVAAAQAGAVPYFYSAVYQKGDQVVWIEAQPICNNGTVYQLLLCEANFPRNEVFPTIPVKRVIENARDDRIVQRWEAIDMVRELEQGFIKEGMTLHFEQPYQDRHVSVVSGVKAEYRPAI